MLTKKSFGLTICRINGTIETESIIEKLSEFKLKPTTEIREEAILGFVNLMNFMPDITESTVKFGNHYYLSLRKAQRKIPASLFKTIQAKSFNAYMTENGKDFVPTKEKKRINAEILEKHTVQMPPVFTDIPIVLDVKDNLCFILGSGQKKIDTVAAIIFKLFSVDIVPVTPSELFSDSEDYSTFQLSACPVPEDVPRHGRDFLLWIWYMTGKQTMNDSAIACIMGDIKLVSEEDEPMGCVETIVKKGNTTNSNESLDALKQGKKIKVAGMAFSDNLKQSWRCNLDADTFSMSGFKCPEGEEMDVAGLIEERIESIKRFHDVFCESFKNYATAKRNPETNEKIKEWINEG